MSLLELLKTEGGWIYNVKGDSVPNAWLGCFRRRSISFADGLTDTQTRVFWVQSRNFTIDLRLPYGGDSDRDVANACEEGGEKISSLSPLSTPLQYEGWCSDSILRGDELSWGEGVSLQLENRWPEPARLHRVGNCLIEFAPSGVYVEDWRLQPSRPGPMLGLKMLREVDAHSGESLREGGGLVICGDHAAWARPRSLRAQEDLERWPSLQDAVDSEEAWASKGVGEWEMEVSVASREGDGDYKIDHSTLDQLVGSKLQLDGFLKGETGLWVQQIECEGRVIERYFEVDLCIPEFDFVLSTPTSDDALGWMARHQNTLGRYKEALN